MAQAGTTGEDEFLGVTGFTTEDNNFGFNLAKKQLCLIN